MLPGADQRRASRRAPRAPPPLESTHAACAAAPPPARRPCRPRPAPRRCAIAERSASRHARQRRARASASARRASTCADRDGAPPPPRRRRWPPARGRRPWRRPLCAYWSLDAWTPVLKPIPRRPAGPAAAVVAAMRADAVRRLGLVALRAQAGGGARQRVVRAALRRAGLGMSSFWIRHCSVVSDSSIAFERRQPRIFPLRRAVARRRYSGSCRTAGTAPAVVPAQRLHRQRQVELLAQQLVQIDLVVAVIARSRSSSSTSRSSSARHLRRRQIAQVERRVHRQPERLEAPAARQLELGPHRARPAGTGPCPCGSRTPA